MAKLQSLEEVLRLGDLQKGGISNTTANYKDIRQNKVGSESQIASCIKAGIGKNSDDVVFVFNTISTYDKSKKVNPKTFKIVDNTDNVYELWINVVECLSALKAIKEEFEDVAQDLEPDEEVVEDSEEEPNLEESLLDDVKSAMSKIFGSKKSQKNAITKEDIAVILEVCDLTIWCNDPSFHWQGMNYNLSQMGAALFPTNIKPKKWDAVHGDNMQTKHLSGLLEDIDHFYGQMAQKLTDVLRKKGIKIV